MVFAFSGLLLSSTTSLNQMGMLLSFAALVDTFVFRAIFVPSFMGLLGEKNWWPSKRLPLHETLVAPDPLPLSCGKRRHRQGEQRPLVNSIQERSRESPRL